MNSMEEIVAVTQDSVFLNREVCLLVGHAEPSPESRQ